jgi:hypothetical protein
LGHTPELWRATPCVAAVPHRLIAHPEIVEGDAMRRR